MVHQDDTEQGCTNNAGYSVCQDYGFILYNSRAVRQLIIFICMSSDQALESLCVITVITYLLLQKRNIARKFYNQSTVSVNCIGLGELYQKVVSESCISKF